MPGSRRAGVVVGLAAAAVAAVPALARHGSARDAFAVRRLVSDAGPPAAVRDPLLVNAWGLAASSTGPWWTSSEARGASTLYAGDGRKQALAVSVPCGPTGVVFNGGSGFPVRGGGRTAPARFLYACEDGTVRGWSPTVPEGWSAETEVTVDAAGSGAVFRGLALAPLGSGRARLYVADFHNGRVLAFDERWRPVRVRGGFRDPAIPRWYAPFNVLAAGGRLFVSFAWPAPVNGNDVPSGGYVDEFDLEGRLLARVAHGRPLAEPWGLAVAPHGFGRLGGDLLVASFGSGRIAAYARRGSGWSYRGELRGRDGRPLRVPGVWGIAFGNGGMAGPRTTLFAAAGPHRWHGASEVAVHGLLAAVEPAG